MKSARMLAPLTFAVMVITACAGPRATEPSGQGAPSATRPSRPLVVLTRGEPVALTVRAFQTVGGASYPHLVLNATFDDQDQDGNRFPVLAEAMPELNTDTWRVSPDGTMETAYHLRPGIVWHDGTPLEAADFVFAWRVYANPASGSATGAPVGEMREVSAPDNRTVVITWRRPYPSAAALYSRTQSGFGALPRHILEGPTAPRTLRSSPTTPSGPMSSSALVRTDWRSGNEGRRSTPSRSTDSCSAGQRSSASAS